MYAPRKAANMFYNYKRMDLKNDDLTGRLVICTIFYRVLDYLLRNDFCLIMAQISQVIIAALSLTLVRAIKKEEQYVTYKR